jgi:hypothetical protein
VVHLQGIERVVGDVHFDPSLSAPVRPGLLLPQRHFGHAGLQADHVCR